MEEIKKPIRKKIFKNQVERKKKGIDRKSVSKKILDFVCSYADEMTPEEKRKLLKNLDYLMEKWIREHSDYYGMEGDRERWDALTCMEFVLGDLLEEWYDRIALSLGEESYMDKKGREFAERVAASAKLIVYNDEDLPF